ncbi:hypothetical protein [Pseudomonas sp. 22 E 5]|nr:hypothetical protein [Pseudomonas sp. 22 E 5]
MPGQRQDIAGALAQWAEFEADHIQAVVEVFAKVPRVDGFFQLHVGGRQYAYINRNALARTQAHHFTFL